MHRGRLNPSNGNRPSSKMWGIHVSRTAMRCKIILGSICQRLSLVGLPDMYHPRRNVLANYLSLFLMTPIKEHAVRACKPARCSSIASYCLKLILNRFSYIVYGNWLPHAHDRESGNLVTGQERSRTNLLVCLTVWAPEYSCGWTLTNSI